MHHPQPSHNSLQGQRNTHCPFASNHETAHKAQSRLFSLGSGLGESRALHPAGGPPTICHHSSPNSPRLDALKWGQTEGGRQLPEDNTRSGRGQPARHIGAEGWDCCILAPIGTVTALVHTAARCAPAGKAAATNHAPACWGAATNSALDHSQTRRSKSDWQRTAPSTPSPTAFHPAQLMHQPALSVQLSTHHSETGSMA